MFDSTESPRSANGTQLTGGGLVAGWEGVMASFAKGRVLPRLANKTAIGVFLGATSAQQHLRSRLVVRRRAHLSG